MLELRVRAEDHCFVCLVDLRLFQDFAVKRRPINQEDALEAGDGIPNVLWHSLGRVDDDDVLEVVLEVLRSQWKYEVVYGRVDSTYDDMVLQLEELLLV